MARLSVIIFRLLAAHDARQLRRNHQWARRSR